MKRIYIFRTLLTLSVLFGVLLPVIDSPTASAMTQAKCVEKFQDKTPGPAYFDTDCDKSKGGKCQVEQYGASANSQGIDCNNSHTPVEPTHPGQTNAPEGCAGIETSLINCDDTGGNPVISLLLQVINFLAVGVGIAVVGGIIWGGMIYASSNGDASKVQQAKTIIVNAVVGLLLFFFMYALINYLVPGGLFK